MSAARDIKTRDVPAVIVGTGAAGLACALALAPMPVVVLTKTAAAASGTSELAQGGIAAALGPSDSPRQHAADTLSAGAGLSDGDRVGELVGDGVDAVTDLLARGFPADRDPSGGLALGREAAHAVHRIVHAGGDATGHALVATLLSEAAATPSVEIVSETVAIDLLIEDGRVAGVLAYGQSVGWIAFRTPAVILATGGCGALWTDTTNPDEATADGLAMAARAGVRLADLEFVQFHPTALLPGGGLRRGPLRLLTEALRGAGAKLVDRRGLRIMAGEHPLGDLAPRDVVARTIWHRRAAGEPVYLDLRPALAGGGAAAFPNAIAACREAGYDPLAEPVPVAPAAHYHMGGILTDGDGRSSLAGLWACGEVASTGVHGANRLASNSLLEALVFGRRVAVAVKHAAGESARPVGIPAHKPGLAPPVPVEQPALRTRLRGIMSRQVGLIRHGAGLSEALKNLESLQALFTAQPPGSAEDDLPCFDAVRRWSELRNMLLAGRLIAMAALHRPESRGAHFRCDVPQPRSDWARRQVLTIDDLTAQPRAATAV